MGAAYGSKKVYKAFNYGTTTNLPAGQAGLVENNIK